MPPQVATSLKPQQNELVTEPVTRRRLIRPRLRSSALVRDLAPYAVDTGVSAALQRRETLHRRMLGAADVCAAAGALIVVLSWCGARTEFIFSCFGDSS